MDSTCVTAATGCKVAIKSSQTTGWVLYVVLALPTPNRETDTRCLLVSFSSFRPMYFSVYGSHEYILYHFTSRFSLVVDVSDIVTVTPA